MKYIKIVIFLSLFTPYLHSQNENNLIWVRLNKEIALPKSKLQENKESKSKELNDIFKEYSVLSYKQALPFAKNPKLQEIYEITLKSNPENFKFEIEKRKLDIFKEFNIKKNIPIRTFEPSDSMWTLTRQYPDYWLWYLTRIQMDKAWDITKGSDDIILAVVDDRFDLVHPDLAEKFIINYDPLSNINHVGLMNNGNAIVHGTACACTAVGHTNGGGPLASTGFNTKFIGYSFLNNYGLTAALHASNVMGAKVISISFYYSCYPNPDDALIVKEILDNGTIVCASAGNGSINCNGNDLYPFGSGNDSRVIVVSTTGRNDSHKFCGTTNSHYPGVDICAPGEANILALPSIGSSWPYLCINGQTSTATPMVAGVCALMLAVNPCLSPEQVEVILKNTADPIIDADSFPGLLGGGRINAFKAVKEAGTRIISDTTFYGTNVFYAGYGFNIKNLTLSSYANISLVARKEVNITSGFDVPLGSSFSIDIDSLARSNCE